MKSHSTTKRHSLYEEQNSSVDPYSTNIVDELLENSEEWRGSEQIVRLTLKAISDIVHAQGQSIQDIKAVLTTRASKAELTTGMSLKANISDISQTIQEISEKMDITPTYSELNSILGEYVHRTDLSHQMAASSSKESEAKDEEASKKLRTQMQVLQTRMEEFQREVARKLSNCVNLDQFQESLNIIDMKANSSEVNEALENLISKQDLALSLQKKVNKSDLERQLEAKAQASDLEHIINGLESKVNLHTLEKLTQVIENKADRSDLVIAMNEKYHSHSRKKHSRSVQSSEEDLTHQTSQASLIKNIKAELFKDFSSHKSAMNGQLEQLSNESKQLRRRIKDIHNEMLQNINLSNLEFSKSTSMLKLQIQEGISIVKSQIKTLTEEFNYKNKNDIVMKEISNEVNVRKRCQEKIYEEIDEVRRKSEENLMKVVESNQLGKFQNEVLEMISGKVEMNEVKKVVEGAMDEAMSRFDKESETNTLLLEKLQRTYSEAISANTSDIVKLSKTVCKKQDKYDQSLFEENIRKCRSEVEDCRKTVDKVYSEAHQKLSLVEYETDLIQLKKKFDKLKAEIDEKANIKDVCTLADSKPNIDDVNMALKELNDLLNEKINEKELNSILKDQSAINETLCSENIVGRWMWQSGELKAGGLIPWEIESANTVPEHFFWEKNKTSILILAPGIYEFKACIFNSLSTLSILINGEALGQSVKSDQNYNTSNTGLSRQKSMSQGKKRLNRNRDICGNKIEYFAILPARSRVSICCVGEAGQGFLNIKRL